jgi:orotidine-5'-phosphate decarboxylase
MAKDVIIACDFSAQEELFCFLKKLRGRTPYLKVGMELFYAAGPQLVRELKANGFKVFLDLKLHDIPNTVMKAMSVLTGLGTDIINVHAAGTSAMMTAALKGAERSDGSRPLIIAVTQLTSTSEETMQKELLIGESMESAVAHYAENTKNAGLDGVVCSPLEAGLVKARCGNAFLTVTPGIRFPEGEKGDQSRIATPADARRLGSDYIVMGRPITAAPDPAAAYDRAVNEFLGG